MHSRKSIFYRGIVFIASVFAMAIFSQFNVKAEVCEIKLQDESPYLTFGGSNSNWSDSGLEQASICTSEERTTYQMLGTYVNGSQIDRFVPSNYGSGYYTIEYRYRFLGAEHSLYRYVRILDANFDTSKNYTLGAFNAFEKVDDKIDAQVVNAFYDSSTKNIVNFVMNNGKTYVVVTNLVGKELNRQEISYNIGSNLNIDLKDVVRSENNYTLIGSVTQTSTSGIVKTISVVGDQVYDSASNQIHQEGVVYNSGFAFGTSSLYLVGKDSSGYPIIHLYSTATINPVYRHTARGEYSSLIIKGSGADAYLYAVGYEQTGTNATKGLYTYLKTSDVNNTIRHVQLFEEDAKFTKIVANGTNNNIVIGETYALQISAGGTISAINTKAGYSDALILEIDNQGLVNVHAGMYGSASNDIFTNITHLGGNKYSLVGKANDGSNTLVYTIDISDFSVVEEIVSRKSEYIIYGSIYTPNGTSYYGEIVKGKSEVVDIPYYNEVTSSDPLLLVLDNRKFINEYGASLTNETINLVRVDDPTEEHYKYCYYKITYNGQEFTPTSCGGDTFIPSAVITQEGMIGVVLEYHIDTETGGKIILYRTVIITNAPVPVDLVNGQTGILKWYTYNRSYTYVSSTAVRLTPGRTSLEVVQNGVQTTASYNFDFSYYFTGTAYKEKTIFDMINTYLTNGNTTGYNMDYIQASHADAKIFEHSDQTSAAFGSIEYAKMFAYYQEFSRVVRVEGNVSRETLGASLYSGQYIPEGSSYYIYYIDFIGNSSTSNAVDSCRITSSSISNCSGKAGYAFSSLKAVNAVIKDFLAYNNYFVTTRNTIYNGSVPASEIEEYAQELYTREYVTSYEEKVRAATSNLTFNVYELKEGALSTQIYSGSKKNVYFGGQYVSSSVVNEGGNDVTVYSYLYNGTTYQNLKAQKDAPEGSVIYYYYNDTSVYIAKNACYEVYYSYGTGGDFVKGASKIFCLDNTAPAISYHVENAEIGVNAEHNSTSQRGNSVDTPAYISRDFWIVDILDTDDYAYIMVNKTVYPITCSDNSMTCLTDINEYIKQTFRYNKNNPTKVNSISFADRSGNQVTFYFVVGTVPPSLQVTDLAQENTGTADDPELVTTSFVLTVNFYETNSIKDFMITSLSRQSCSVVDSSDFCYDGENDDTIFADDSNAAREFNEMVTNYIYAVSYRDRENIDGTITLTPDAEGLYVNPINAYVYKIENRQFVEVSGYQERYDLKGAAYEEDGETFYLADNFFTRGDSIYYYVDGQIQGKRLSKAYSELTTEPSDWATAYSTYYFFNESTRSYMLNADPVFTPNVYFQREVSFENTGTVITLNNNNQFKFAASENRRYQLIIDQDEIYIEALPIAYELEDDNTFRIDYNDSNGRIIYSYDPTSGLIEYANPLILTSKRIELIFTRTTKTLEGIVSGGVDVPYTTPKYKAGTQTIEVDALTGLPVYEIDETKGSRHFNIVDGVYEFNITQGQDFGALKPVSGSIYVTQLDLKIGYSISKPGVLTPTDGGYTIEGVTGAPFDFTGTVVNATQLATFDNSSVYPLSSSQISALSGYEKTYFTSNSVFAGFTIKPQIAFTIKVYQAKNAYGLPASLTACKEILILGSAYTAAMPYPTTATCTSIERSVMYLPKDMGDAGTMDYAVLKQYGIYELLSGGGAYLFSGLNTFYTISAIEYQYTDQGYSKASDLLEESFYIDNSFNEATLDAKVTQVSTDNNGDLVFSPNVLYTFEKINDEYTLKGANGTDTVGGADNVHFDLNYYEATNVNDSKENKLLLMHLIVNGTPYTCNVYKAIADVNYANECTGRSVNVTLSDDEEPKLLFSGSGNYKVMFSDASGNSVTYNFSIDKSAPTISLNAVDDTNIDFVADEDGDAYQVLAFTKDPKLTIYIEDGLSSVTAYCYKFIYGNNVSTTDICPTVANSEYQLTLNIKMSDTPEGKVLIENLIASEYDGNVILSIRATDALGNQTEKEMEVHFWADYKKPTFEEHGTFSVNKTYVTNEEINAHDGTRAKTITIISNDYVGKTFTCGAGGFSFLDSRYVTSEPEYTYILRCLDTHNSANVVVNAFDNTITMVFYEVDDTGATKTIKMKPDGKTPVEFQFGVPTSGGNARWIYVTVMDTVGNISTEGQFLPIIVEDGISPEVVENGVKKCIDEEAGVCNEWEIVSSHDYVLKNDSSPSTVYLANSSVKVTFSEYISKIVSCTTTKYDRNGSFLTSVCEYPTDTSFEYDDGMLDFIFTTNNDDINTFRIIKFNVSDFAGRESVQIVIVIDRINPEIEFMAGREGSEYIEYATTNKSYDDAYNYAGDLSIYDDQGSVLTTVGHEFYRYAPLLTYKNYKKNDQGRFERVPDYTSRDDGTYYLLIKSSLVNDKTCVATSDADPNYCYVIDTQNTYYFADLLEHNTYNDIQVWTGLGTNLQPLTKIDGNTGIAVYKVAYQVTDFAGNKSNILYKQVFVMDTISPDLNIQDDRGNLLFSNITSTNPDNFNGKINDAVTFVATDSPEAITSSAKVLFYKCDISKYKESPESCAATKDLLYNPAGTPLGQYNSQSFKRNAANGVYKAFAYDVGQYEYEAELLYNESTGVYVLNKNISTIYFVINRANVDAVYTIYGNKYTSDYMGGSLAFVENDTNYIEIKNGANSSDVTLMAYDGVRAEYMDASKINAIGYRGFVDYQDSVEGGKKVVTVYYRDDKGRSVYEIKYKEADLTKGFMVHESYYYLVGTDAEACFVGKDESNCEKNPSSTYVISSVIARIYEDGVYESLILQDSYGNRSPIGNVLKVDNTAYTVNADNNKPTGVNYWYSVPKAALGVDNVSLYSALRVPNYSILVNKPLDWEMNYLTYYLRDGDGYVLNTNTEFIPNTYYSVDYSIATDVNLFESKYNGNLNSSSFYAIASYEEAKVYMYNLYYDAVTAQIEHGYEFYDAYGQVTPFNAGTSVDTVMNTILQDIYEMIIPTFTADRKFSDSEMKQDIYSGIEINSTMYQYTYLLRTRIVINGAISYTYALAGDTCSPAVNQECIKVNLKIISSVNDTVEINIDTTQHNVSCVSSGLGWGGVATNSACSNPILVAGQEATIVFIDQDINEHHTNVVYFGVRVYSETTDLNYVELGTYVPMEKIQRYDNDHNLDEHGDYIWINSEWWQLSKIENTNLYKNTCEFGGLTYNKGCVFVTYFSTYNFSMGTYKPAKGGVYYYDYYRDGYYNEKGELIENVNTNSSSDVEFTYSNGWDICTSQGYSCPLIPVYATNNTIVNVPLKNQSGYETSRYLNKKSHIELFNSKRGDISRLFEVTTVVKNGRFAEIYSYATLAITTNGEMKYYNINRNIIRVDGYSLINTKPSDWDQTYALFYTFDGTNYVANTNNTWASDTYYVHDAFACIVDVKIETANIMTIMDSAGNRIVFNISHTDDVAEIQYSTVDSNTNSNVLIGMTTTSKVTGLSNDYVKVYKYDLEDEEYELISSNNSNLCYTPLTGTSGVLPATIEFRFNYHADYNCVGAYKIEIVDNFGNSNFKEFIFNPYVINNTISTSVNGYSNNIHVYDDVHIIANNFFTIDVNANLNYINIYKYPSYTNLTIDSVGAAQIEMITIASFAGATTKTIGTCELSISDKGSNIYTVAAINDATHSCDGVYKIEVVNIFSDKITRLERFAGIEGSNQLILTTSKPIDWEINYDRYYYKDLEGNYVQVAPSTTWVENKYYGQTVISGFAANEASGYTIELDSVAPDSSLLSGDDQNFNIYLDDEENPNVQDTKTLISSPSKTIEYTNTYVTIGWGGYESYSFASLAYRVKAPGETEFSDTWTVITEGVSYAVPYNATFKFVPNLPGLHEYEFKFVDAVGNEDGEAVYRLKITINPPNVGLYEVLVDANGNPLYDASNAVIQGRKYAHGERIPTQAILKCTNGLLVENCELGQYTYAMVVNGNTYNSYGNSEFAIKDPISQDSVFLYGSEDREKDEIRIQLTVSIVGKPTISTELFVIIDRKAPVITIDGTTATGTTTYINSVEVSLDRDDVTNIATIYKCDAVEDYGNDMKCMTRLPNGNLVEGGVLFDTIDSGEFTYMFDVFMSGYFMIVATDDPVNLGNVSKAWFALDNEAPTINVTNGLVNLAPYMYTNAENIKAIVVDELSEFNSKIQIEYVALHDEDKALESTIVYDSLLGLTKEGKYILTPVDGVGKVGESITFYIYRQEPEYELSGDSKSVRKDVVLSWVIPESEMIAPIVSVTLDGASYHAEYSSEDKKYTGDLVKTFGEHTFVVVDAAGNRSVVMITINNNNNVCINGNSISVKRQYSYSVDSLIIGGKEEGFTYSEDDVIIFALPTQPVGSECISNGLLGYRTLDPENSHFLISSTSIANRLTNNQFDFVSQGKISKEAIKEVQNIGGTVIVFVVTKDVANNVLGYRVGTNFFMDDPIGWTVIFVSALLALIPSYRIFFKKKVRVI